MVATAFKVLVRHGNDNYGPYTVDELNTMLQSGRVLPESLAWIEGAPEWQKLHTVPGVRTSAPAAAPPAPPVAPPRSARQSAGHAAGHPAGESDRLVLPAFLLAFFLGVFGVHRFYCGKTGSGIVMLLLTISVVGLFVSGIWATIDWIVIACGGFRDDEGKLLRRWT